MNTKKTNTPELDKLNQMRHDFFKEVKRMILILERQEKKAINEYEINKIEVDE